MSRLFATLIAAAMLIWAAPASALTPTTTEYPTGAATKPAGIALGPDGNLWFADRGTPPAIGRMTPSGAVHEFDLGVGSSPLAIAAGPDGNLWFTDPGTGAIGRIAPSGSVTEFPVSGGTPSGIAAGPDGNLWFTDRGNASIGRITPSGSVVEFPVSGSDPTAIAAGPDGNLWFADPGNGAIGRITTAGSAQEFGSALKPQGIAAGPDGDLWFTDKGAIGRVSPSGHIDEFSAGLGAGSSPSAIAAGPDEALWFTDTSAIGRATLAGGIDEFGLAKTSAPGPGITTGPDGDMWFTDQGATPAIGRITTPPAATTGSARVIGAGAAVLSGTVDGRAQSTSDRFDYGLTPGYGASTPPVAAATAAASVKGLQPSTTYHYRLEATNPTDTAFGADATFTTLPLPILTDLAIDHRAWRRGYRLALWSAGRRRPTGMTITFALNRDSPVRLDFLSPQSGRRQRGHCQLPSRRNRRGRRCTRLALAGSLSFAASAGVNSIRFQGRISGARMLKPGRYQLRVTAADPTYPTPSIRSVNFTIVKG